MCQANTAGLSAKYKCFTTISRAQTCSYCHRRLRLLPLNRNTRCQTTLILINYQMDYNKINYFTTQICWSPLQFIVFLLFSSGILFLLLFSLAASRIFIVMFLSMFFLCVCLPLCLFRSFSFHYSELNGYPNVNHSRNTWKYTTIIKHGRKIFLSQHNLLFMTCILN